MDTDVLDEITEAVKRFNEAASEYSFTVPQAAWALRLAFGDFDEAPPVEYLVGDKSYDEFGCEIERTIPIDFQNGSE